MFIGRGLAVAKLIRSLNQSILVGLSVVLAASSCTEPFDSGGRLNKDASQVQIGDGGSPLDHGAADGHAGGDGATDRSTLAHLFVDSTSHDFGLVPVNTSSAGGTFTVTNDGGATSDVLSVVLDGASAGFSLITDECSRNSLAAGASCRVVVGFSPTVAGKQQGSVAFHATGSDASATVLGEGITP
jgi:hypothetical protein